MQIYKCYFYYENSLKSPKQSTTTMNNFIFNGKLTLQWRYEVLKTCCSPAWEGLTKNDDERSDVFVRVELQLLQVWPVFLKTVSFEYHQIYGRAQVFAALCCCMSLTPCIVGINANLRKKAQNDAVQLCVCVCVWSDIPSILVLPEERGRAKYHTHTTTNRVRGIHAPH